MTQSVEIQPYTCDEAKKCLIVVGNIWGPCLQMWPVLQTKMELSLAPETAWLSGTDRVCFSFTSFCQKYKTDSWVCPHGAEELSCPGHIWALLGINPGLEYYLTAVTKWLEKVYLKYRLASDRLWKTRTLTFENNRVSIKEGTAGLFILLLICFFMQ